jgi:uncharacterized protein (DUF362 family)
LKKLLFLLALVIAAGFTACKDPDKIFSGYTITFNSNGGTGYLTPVRAVYGEAMPALAGAPPYWDGYSLTGFWDGQTNGTKYYNADLSPAKELWDKKINTTLYAQWVPTPEESPASTVALVQSEKAQASSLDYSDIKALVTEAVAKAGGFDSIVKSGDVVVLKPNIVCAFYNWGSGPGNGIPMLLNGVGADWRVIQATAELVREIIGPYNSATGKGKIMLIEGPANGSGSSHFAVMGWTKENLAAVDEIIGLNEEGTTYSAGAGSTAGDILDFNTQVALADYKYKTAPAGSYFGASPYTAYYKNDGKYWVNKKMFDADALISIPVLKNHSNACVTGAIKNISIGATPPKIYGINSGSIGRNGMVNHSSINLHEWIADYFACLPADFTVMDGLQGLQNGPGAGANLSALQSNQKNMRCILASKDPLALDIVEANIMNWDYTTVPYMTYLAERGEVGGKPNGRTIPLRGDPKDIVVLGNKKVDDVRTTFAGSMQIGNVGSQISQANLAKPAVTINSATFSGQNLYLDMALSAGANNKVVKTDVYIDGAYAQSFNANMANVSLDASSLASGSHSVEIRAYTRFMSCAIATATTVK